MLSRLLITSTVFSLAVESGVNDCPNELFAWNKNIQCGKHKYYNDKWHQIGRSVVYFLTSGCTGWKYSENIYATAKHCDIDNNYSTWGLTIGDEQEIVFDYVCNCGSDMNGHMKPSSRCTLPGASKRCTARAIKFGGTYGNTYAPDDWALWRVDSDCEANKSRAIIKVGNTNDAKKDNKVMLIHHPGRRSKIITRENKCKITDSNWMFQKIQCSGQTPAEGGSSGGPVFHERNDGEVVVIGINQSLTMTYGKADCKGLKTVPIGVLMNKIKADQQYECARFFEHTNGHGKHMSMKLLNVKHNLSMTKTLNSSWNDKISSLYVKPFCKVTAYKHSNGGENWTFKHYQLAHVEVNLTWFSFNDHISKIKCTCDFSTYSNEQYPWSGEYKAGRRLEEPDTILVKPVAMTPPEANAVLARLLDGEANDVEMGEAEDLETGEAAPSPQDALDQQQPQGELSEDASAAATAPTKELVDQGEHMTEALVA